MIWRVRDACAQIPSELHDISTYTNSGTGQLPVPLLAHAKGKVLQAGEPTNKALQIIYL